MIDETDDEQEDLPGMGDNQGPELEPDIETLNQTAQGQLRSVIARIENLEQDKAAVMDDLKEVYAEAKGNGFDTKILRKVIRIRAQDAAKRAEEEALIDLYVHAIGDAP